MADPQQRRFVDSHLHLWDLLRSWYPVIEGFKDEPPAEYREPENVARTYLLDDYLADAAPFEVEAIVHVNATQEDGAALKETEWLEGIATESRLPIAIISGVEPSVEPADVEAELDAQAAASARFRGVRSLAGLHGPIDFDSPLESYLSILAERSLVFDLVAHPGDLAGAAVALGRHPELRTVLEHVGWPLTTGEAEAETWRSGITELATLPNVCCKLSGVPMFAHSHEPAALRPWVEHCLGEFGADRCMVGSNFPIDAAWGKPLSRLLDAYASVITELDEPATDAVFRRTALEFYAPAAAPTSLPN